MLTDEGLARAYAGFPDWAADSLVDLWVRTRRAAWRLLGTAEGDDHSATPGGYVLPHVRYEHVINTLFVSMAALAKPLYYPKVPAIEVAHAAWLAVREPQDLRLSIRWSEAQLFFITACYAMCAHDRLSKLHAGQCNKAVQNFAPFAEAFNCSPGARMNPENKCTFFDRVAATNAYVQES
ncbi:uncharacterized protein LOC125942739 [Dermacentor silvarum]|uniref:uncharacterized protein LOC125942739 n=1 Tax=Dermacentor silvarum TaxID=543639 RepID=UPI002100DD8E|nr:uncharacterized protein LOC125942739 [Dermacentor silvarum]